MSGILLFISGFTVLLCLVGPSSSARILGLFPTPSKSHLIVHTSITDALALRGHDITVLTTISLPKNNARIRHIQLDVPAFDSSFFEMVNKPPPLHRRFDQFITIGNYANVSLNHPTMKKLMAEESFDLVIYGYFFNEFLLGVAGSFKCPVVMSLAVRPFAPLNDMMGNPNEVAYVPGLLAGRQPFGFWQRVKNFLSITLIEDGLLKQFLHWQMTRYYNNNFPQGKYPSFEDMKKNVSLILTNHHFSQTPIRPNVPAIVEIGGIQIKEKPDPLPENIEGILDSSGKHGVIYFSLGSNIEGSHLNSAKVKMIFDALSKLPQTVLWKWGDSELPGKSPNIIYRSWLPQVEILAHPQVKLFITHGGFGSVVESQYHGVPMVGIPLFGDQSTNMYGVEQAGFGLALDYLTLTEEKLINAVKEVLSNNKYREHVQRFAKVYKDRPMTARETAVFWVEYVLRHHGAPHLQSPAVHLNAFQLLSLDVIGFILLASYIVFQVLKVTLSVIFKALSSHRKAKKE